jgi:hypothetical protein
VWRFLSGGPLLLAASCSAPAPDDAPRTTIEKSDLGDGEFITIESDTRLGGTRPKLTLVCESGKPASFQLDLERLPPSPPPLRANFAQVQVKGGPKVTIELGWMGKASWAPRMPHSSQPDSEEPDRNNQERVLPILHAFARERALTITPPASSGLTEDLVWSPDTYAPHGGLLRRCTELDRFPDREG